MTMRSSTASQGLGPGACSRFLFKRDLGIEGLGFRDLGFRDLGI